MPTKKALFLKSSEICSAGFFLSVTGFLSAWRHRMLQEKVAIFRHVVGTAEKEETLPQTPWLVRVVTHFDIKFFFWIYLVKTHDSQEVADYHGWHNYIPHPEPRDIS
jgi:hypothetical protein